VTPNTFAGAGLDRAGAHRGDADWVRARLADPASRAIVASAEGVLVQEDERGVRPRLVPLAAATALAQPVLLGLDGGGAAVFALDAGAVQSQALDEPGARLRGLRDVAAQLTQADGGILAYASALLGWHRRHGFCSVCGAPTEPGEAGHVRTCPRCGAQHHPRTDPVVIMLVTDGDRALLGRRPTWPAGRFSTLAGFVEPGESLEEAVAREVLEEAGVRVAEPRYRSSQPWPFPASLMLGFLARYDGGEARALDGELEEVRWLTREELRRAAAGEHPVVALPPPDAIARRLMEEWLREPQASAG
jgi:NAD+ diphosphatase